VRLYRVESDGDHPHLHRVLPAVIIAASSSMLLCVGLGISAHCVSTLAGSCYLIVRRVEVLAVGTKCSYRFLWF
jgi:hypothetical protein